MSWELIDKVIYFLGSVWLFCIITIFTIVIILGVYKYLKKKKWVQLMVTTLSYFYLLNIARKSDEETLSSVIWLTERPKRSKYWIMKRLAKEYRVIYSKKFGDYKSPVSE